MSSSEDTHGPLPSLALEELLERATEGDKDAIRVFLKSFLAAQVWVPDRYQPKPADPQPSYPSDLFSLMGICDEERTLIPCFSSPEALKLWTSHTLQVSQVIGLELLKRTPDDWWVVLNPGSDASKEFSAWEITKLRSGAEAIDEIVHDLSHAEPAVNISVGELLLDANDPVLLCAKRYATNTHSVRELYLANEVSLSAEGEEFTCTLIGLLCSDAGALDYQSELQAELDKLRIGDTPVRVIASPMKDSLQFSIFEKLTPVWKRPSLIDKVLARFR